MVRHQRHQRRQRCNLGVEAVSDGIFPTAPYADVMVPKLIVNGYSSNGFTKLDLANGSLQGLPSYNAGSMTANTLKQVLTLSGPGVLEFLTVLNQSGTRTMRIKLVIDGVTVLDATSGSLTAVGTVCLVGDCNTLTGITAVSLDAIPFASSVQLWLASSLTETGAFYGQYQYRSVQ